MTKKQKPASEPDSVFFLKILILLIISTMWLRLSSNGEFSGVELNLPLGSAAAIFLVQFDHFTIDRKIEYVVVLLSSFISFFLPIGLII